MLAVKLSRNCLDYELKVFQGKLFVSCLSVVACWFYPWRLLFREIRDLDSTCFWVIALHAGLVWCLWLLAGDQSLLFFILSMYKNLHLVDWFVSISYRSMSRVKQPISKNVVSNLKTNHIFWVYEMGGRRVSAAWCLICFGKNTLANKGGGCKGDRGHRVCPYFYSQV